jgi:hypothetical protein
MMGRAVTAIIAVAAAGTVYAQQPPPSEPITVVGEHPNKKPDPNEVICEKQQEIGSRIVSKRVCMTRSQWQEQRRLDRQDLDRAQNQRPMR